jgi:hypothetical protein
VIKDWITVFQMAIHVYQYHQTHFIIECKFYYLTSRDNTAYIKSEKKGNLILSHANVLFLPMGMLLSSFGTIFSLVRDLTGDPANGLCFLLRWVP